MKWYIVNKDYIDYLKEFDDKVSDVSYNNHVRLFLGKFLNIDGYNNIKYYIPVSSAKPKHMSMEDRVDFIKLFDSLGEIAGVLNLNNMIPVPDFAVKEFDYTAVRDLDGFENTSEKDKYYRLSMDELQYCNSISDFIEHNASALYGMTKSKSYQFRSLRQRCCNFIKLQNCAIEYNDIINYELDNLMNNVSKKLIDAEKEPIYYQKDIIHEK